MDSALLKAGVGACPPDTAMYFLSAKENCFEGILIIFVCASAAATAAWAAAACRLELVLLTKVGGSFKAIWMSRSALTEL